MPHALMLAACAVALIASEHEQRAFLLSTEAAHPRPGVVVAVARSRRSGISTFFPNIFSNRDESLAGEDRWRRNEWKLDAHPGAPGDAARVGDSGGAGLRSVDLL